MRGVEAGSWAERMCSKAEAGGWGWTRQQLEEQVVPHLHVDKLGETTGEQERLHNPGLQLREIKPQNLWLKTPVGVEVPVEETPSLTEEFIGQTHRVLKRIQTHLTHPGISTRRAQFACGWQGKWLKADQELSKRNCFLSDTSPPTAPHSRRRVAPPWWTPKAPPLTT